MGDADDVYNRKEIATYTVEQNKSTAVVRLEAGRLLVSLMVAGEIKHAELMRFDDSKDEPEYEPYSESDYPNRVEIHIDGRKHVIPGALGIESLTWSQAAGTHCIDDADKKMKTKFGPIPPARPTSESRNRAGFFTTPPPRIVPPAEKLAADKLAAAELAKKAPAPYQAGYNEAQLRSAIESEIKMYKERLLSQYSGIFKEREGMIQIAMSNDQKRYGYVNYQEFADKVNKLCNIGKQPGDMRITVVEQDTEGVWALDLSVLVKDEYALKCFGEFINQTAKNSPRGKKLGLGDTDFNEKWQNTSRVNDFDKIIYGVNTALADPPKPLQEPPEGSPRASAIKDKEKSKSSAAAKVSGMTQQSSAAGGTRPAPPALPPVPSGPPPVPPRKRR